MIGQAHDYAHGGFDLKISSQGQEESNDCPIFVTLSWKTLPPGHNQVLSFYQTKWLLDHLTEVGGLHLPNFVNLLKPKTQETSQLYAEVRKQEMHNNYFHQFSYVFREVLVFEESVHI